MAEATLIFDENSLDKKTSLYELYSRLFEGMRTANTVDAPDFTDNPPLTPAGEIDIDAIDKKMAEYSSILIKNSAYMMANSIVSTLNGNGNGGSAGVGFLSRSGDTMEGRLGALHGFQAGYEGTLILETTINAEKKKLAKVSGSLIVDGDATLSGTLNLSNKGISISNVNVLFYADNKLNIASGCIAMKGNISVDGIFELGQITINKDGLFFNDKEFYHGYNSNKKDVDWNMRNGHVYGTLQVDGQTTLNDTLSAINGFKLGAINKPLFYSDKKEGGEVFLQLATDLSLWSGYGIQFDGRYIIKVRGGLDNTVSFSAPGMTINLGDSDNDMQTKKIALQTGIYNYNSSYQIISQYGDGNFPNSFSAGCGNSGPTVIQTYYKTGEDAGVVFAKKIRLGKNNGPSLNASDIKTLVFEAPYIHVTNDIQQTDYIQSSILYKQTNSLFRDQSLPWSASLNFETDAEFFVFNKPIEATKFSILSEKYKTQLIENALFFGDGIFFEGIVDGILHSGNAYFVDSLSSRRFASGFAGYGWSIAKDKTYGNIAATFDELTIRKKMRVYELEVQKMSVTNGSLWVSDSCSGDLVEEIV
ncbi:hypothetical protein [Bacteroides sp. 224]|uniref:hypothetical protein n=1 Tax=Bacteroides sp. 224 TaxID=2302936 RepID=UPI0013D4CB0C|nr:hypothetical protein [Bacteroides sp. 224]NDV63943.1 hypothetical protein [Bacteroides sp. 224]